MDRSKDGGGEEYKNKRKKMVDTSPKVIPP
jgi:hypothetical protein